MFIRHLPSFTTSLAAPAMTSGRVGPTLVALMGLVAVVTGSLALADRLGAGRRRGGGMVALVAGLISLVLGGVFAATAAGGPGTGNGIVGAWVAMVFGLIGVVLGGLTLNHRSAR